MKFKRYSTAEDTYTTLPATFQTSGADAENYQVYGKTVENLADAIIEHANISRLGDVFDPRSTDPASDTFVLYIAPVVSGKTYTITTSTYDSAVVYAFYSTQPAYDAVSYNNARTVLEGTHQATITAPITGWIAFRDYVTAPAGMIVEGSTPAPIYVPPGASGGVGEATSGDEPQGYKIPISLESGVTENLLNPENVEKGRIDNGVVGYQSGTSALTWDNSTNRINYTTTTLYRGFVTEVFDVVPNSYYKLNYTPSDDTTIRIAFYNSSDEWLNEDIVVYSSTSRPYSITIPNDASKMRIAFNATNSGDHYIETPMLTSGSTAPDHYIPHRYESNYDLFVGDSKLYADEYLDFAEQKVYKRTENLVPEVRMANGWMPGYLNNNGSYNPNNATNGEWLSPFIDIDSAASVSIAYTPRLSGRASQSLYYFDSSGNYISHSSSLDNGHATFDAIPSNTAKIKYAFRTGCPTEQEIIQSKIWSSFVLGSTPPSSYIPYLQPTDPPTPFPTLTTYIGENNLSVDTTVQPEKVVLEYAGWREIDAKKYVNGEWVTITPKQYTGGSWS